LTTINAFDGMLIFREPLKKCALFQIRNVQAPRFAEFLEGFALRKKIAPIGKWEPTQYK
jgi:hypothetical protein